MQNVICKLYKRALKYFKGKFIMKKIKLVFLMLLFSNVVYAKQLILTDKDEIKAAQEIYLKSYEFGKMLGPCLDTVGDYFTCLCKHKKTQNNITKLIPKKVKQFPAWHRYKTLKFTDENNKIIILKIRAGIKRTKKPLYCGKMIYKTTIKYLSRKKIYYENNIYHI